MSILSTLSSLGLMAKSREDKRVSDEDRAIKKAESDANIAQSYAATEFSKTQAESMKAATKINQAQEADRAKLALYSYRQTQKDRARAEYQDIDKQMTAGAISQTDAIARKLRIKQEIESAIPGYVLDVVNTAMYTTEDLDNLLKKTMENPMAVRQAMVIAQAKPKVPQQLPGGVGAGSTNTAMPLAPPMTSEQALAVALSEYHLNAEQTSYIVKTQAGQLLTKGIDDFNTLNNDISKLQETFIKTNENLNHKQIPSQVSIAVDGLYQRMYSLYPDKTAELDSMRQGTVTAITRAALSNWTSKDEADEKDKRERAAASILFTRQKEIQQLGFKQEMTITDMNNNAAMARTRVSAAGANTRAGGGGDGTIPNYAATENRILLFSQNESIAKYINDTGTSPNSKIAHQNAISSTSGLIAKNELRTIITSGKSTQQTEPIFQSIARNVGTTANVLTKIYANHWTDEKKVEAAKATIGDTYSAMQEQISDPNVIKRVLFTSLSQIPVPYGDTSIDALIDQSVPRRQPPVIALPTSKATGKKRAAVAPIRPSFGTAPLAK